MATPEASRLLLQWSWNSGHGIVEEGRAEEEKHGIKRMKHTFASSSRPLASHPLVILSSWVVK
jgi:hypothetical protein